MVRTRTPSPAEAGDGAFAWAALGRTAAYRDAWARHGAAGPAQAHEPGPFPIRVQAAADIDAARFEMLAWEDPREADGPALPFWRQRGMPEGSLEPGVAESEGMIETSLAFRFPIHAALPSISPAIASPTLSAAARTSRSAR